MLFIQRFDVRMFQNSGKCISTLIKDIPNDFTRTSCKYFPNRKQIYIFNYCCVLAKVYFLGMLECL